MTLGLITLPAWYWSVPEPRRRPRPLHGRHAAARPSLAAVAGVVSIPLTVALVRGSAAAIGTFARLLLGPGDARAARARRGAHGHARRRRRRRGRGARSASSATCTTARRRGWSPSPWTSAWPSSRLDADPRGGGGAAPRRAQDEARQALIELRDLARGIAPACSPTAAWPRRWRAGRALARRRRAPRSTCAGRLPARSRPPPTSSSPRRSRTPPSTRARRARSSGSRQRGDAAGASRSSDDGRGGADPARQRPRRPAPPRRGARRPLRVASPPGGPTDRRRGAAVRAVIAEDLALLRDGLTRLLEGNGIEVVAAVGDGDALVRACHGHQPDVAVVDVRLPPTFTDEGLRAALEARRRVPGLPVLVLSQYVEQTFAAELLADGRGGVGYLLKDRVADPRDFVEAVRRVARRRHGARPRGGRPARSAAAPRRPARRAHAARARGARRSWPRGARTPRSPRRSWSPRAPSRSTSRASSGS